MRKIIKQQTHSNEIDKFWMRKFNLTQFLFDKQLAFVEDPEPFKVAVCSRRSGKTIACAAHLIHTAINSPNTIGLYITLAAVNAKKLVWRELKKINDEYKLDGSVNDSELSITFRNGSIIYLSGAGDKSEIEKFRGLPIKLCYVDECQSFKSYLEDLINDVISPALLDHAGSLCLIGTPGPVPAGFFYDCSVKSDVWSKHYWTFFDNPHIALKSGKTHQQLLDRELKRRGMTVNDPSIQREFFGKWVLDTNSLLIRYDSKTNDFKGLLDHVKYNYILGIDVGYKDADALAVLAWSEHDPATYLVEEVVTTKQGITELASQIETLDKKYKFGKMVMDMGALGKKIGEELIRRHHLPVEAADKTRKIENVELMNDALRTGKLKAKADSKFAEDSYKVEIDRDKSTPDKIVISDRYHSDIIDAVLYAFKLSPAYSYIKPKEPPKPGTKEWADQLVDNMWEKEKEALMKEFEYQKWLRGEE